MTVHNRAKKEDIAKTVLMPGDPLRAKWIAENFLQGAELVSDVRGMLAFTGISGGKRITVMGHGMGIPSMGIYSHELYYFYNVDTIIRIGSAGAYRSDVHIGDIVIAKDVSSYSRYADEIGVATEGTILTASGELLTAALGAAKELKIKTAVCKAFTTDTFYNKYTLEENIARSSGAAVVEMEGFALYANARKHGKRALMLLTCSDSLVTGEALSPADRQSSFSDMVRLALGITEHID